MRIGEVAERSGVSARMLRHYDRLGVLSPSGRTDGGYRRYRDEDLRRLFCVEALRSLGLRLTDVARVLDDPHFDPAPLVEALLERTCERLDRDTELLRRLTTVRDSRPGSWGDVLRTTALMRGLRDDDASARQRVALGAGGPADPADAAALVDAVLDESEPNVTGALLWALGRSGDAAVPALAEALREGDVVRARRATRALVEVVTPAALEVLSTALTHPDATVRARAALALGARGHRAAVPELVRLVVEGADDVAAGEALGVVAREHGCADEVALLLHHALRDGPAPARRRVAAVLCELPGEAARAALADLVDDADPGVALTARALLHRRG